MLELLVNMKKTASIGSEKIIIDAADSIVGRLATKIAKELLKGKKIDVINAELAVISGNPEHVVGKYMEKIQRGDPYHGPFHPKLPDLLLRRIIRGMLPYKKPKGKDSFKNLKVYLSVPEELKGKKAIKIKEAENNLDCKFITLGKLAEKLGVKKVW